MKPPRLFRSVHSSQSVLPGNPYKKMSGPSVRGAANCDRDTCGTKPARTHGLFCSYRRIIVLAMAATAMLLSACTRASPPAASPTPVSASTPTAVYTSTPDPVAPQTFSPTLTLAPQNYLNLLQQNGRLTATFKALTTFQFNGAPVTLFAEFSVSQVPLTWTGTSFRGRREEAGPGEDSTDEITGTVSEDGSTMIALAYSRQVLHRSANNGTFFRVSLANVPVVGETNGRATGLGTFQKTGADVRKYIATVEYTDGPLNGNQINPTTTYLSTDWTSMQLPDLRVTFEK